ncbi:hypothetical protein D3C72_721630 [compost metagenome]
MPIVVGGHVVPADLAALRAHREGDRVVTVLLGRFRRSVLGGAGLLGLESGLVGGVGLAGGLLPLVIVGGRLAAPCEKPAHGNHADQTVPALLGERPLFFLGL